MEILDIDYIDSKYIFKVVSMLHNKGDGKIHYLGDTFRTLHSVCFIFNKSYDQL